MQTWNLSKTWRRLDLSVLRGNVISPEYPIKQQRLGYLSKRCTAHSDSEQTLISSFQLVIWILIKEHNQICSYLNRGHFG